MIKTFLIRKGFIDIPQTKDFVRLHRTFPSFDYIKNIKTGNIYCAVPQQITPEKYRTLYKNNIVVYLDNAEYHINRESLISEEDMTKNVKEAHDYAMNYISSVNMDMKGKQQIWDSIH
jgi:hypothetical protein